MHPKLPKFSVLFLCSFPVNTPSWVLTVPVINEEKNSAVNLAVMLPATNLFCTSPELCLPGPWHLVPCGLSSFAPLILQWDLLTKNGYQLISCHSLYFFPTQCGSTIFVFYHWQSQWFQKRHSTLWEKLGWVSGLSRHAMSCSKVSYLYIPYICVYYNLF